MDAYDTGKEISAARTAKGLTQKQLAKKLGVTDKAVSKWERGLNYPDITLLKPISEMLEISVVKLLCAEEEPAEKVLDIINEMSVYEKKTEKTALLFRSIVSVIFCIITVSSQMYASYLFDQAGMYGIPQIITGGMMMLPAWVLRNSLWMAVKLWKTIR